MPNHNATWKRRQRWARARTNRVIGAAWIGLLSVVAAGCSDAPPTFETVRLIEESPTTIWTSSECSSDSDTFNWSFRDPGDLEGWTLTGFDHHEIADETLFLVWHSRGPTLDRRVDIAAADLGRIEVTMTADARKPYVRRVYWRRKGEGFSPDRSLQATYTDEPVTRVKRFLFELAEHPQWSGKIEALRFRFASFDDNKGRLESVRGFKRRVDPDALQHAMDRPWLVELDKQLRSARLVAPNETMTWDVDVPKNAALWFGYGIWPYDVTEPTDPVDFRITAQRGDTEQVLFDTALNLSKESEAKWFEGRAELAAFAGQQVRLRFETSSASMLDPLQALPVWGAPEISTTTSQAPNVVLISIDTLRADRMSLYGHERETTPNIDNWARSRGTVFEQAVAPAPWTLPSHVSMLTGIGTLTHGVNHEFAMPESLTTLAELLRAEGYATAAFTGGGFLHPSYGLSQGFDIWGHEQRNVIELDRGLKDALRFMRRNHDRPYLLFLHTYEVHTPYRGREPYFSRLFPDAEEGSEWVIEVRPTTRGSDRFFDRVWRPFKSNMGADERDDGPVDRETAMRCYESGIAYTDERLNDLLVATEGGDRSTIVVLTSDHGEHLGEGGRYSHYSLYDGNLMVPLVISCPEEIPAGRRVPEQVNLIDIVPTILELTGQTIPEDVEGRSLVDLAMGKSDVEPPVAWSCNPARAQGVSMRIDGRRKYIFNNSAMTEISTPEELYDLEADPDEDINIAAASSETAELRGRMRERIREMPGLRVELWNRSSDLVRFDVNGVNRRQIKRIEGSRNSVRWMNNTPVIEVAPKSSIELSFEFWNGKPVEISGIGPSRQDTDHVMLWPLTTDEPLTYRLSDGQWLLAAAGTTDFEVGMRLRWVGLGTELDDGASDEIDADLAEQLRALGYIQ